MTNIPVIKDMILFYRVYAVWGFRKKVLLPVFSTVLVSKGAESGVRRVSSASYPACTVFLVLELIVIATRIRDSASPDKPFSYQVLTLVHKSSPIFGFVNAFANSLMTLMIASRVPSSATLGVIAMGLGPTLIAVRVGLGSAYDHRSSDTAQSSAVLLSTDIESQ
ncbi:hypothetical protein D9757_008657 [Collybiopsis confluens]|uniref:Uncharacterized protein n=1 Tax=Collybiopsis confluens TaxID=2823264 RepID=A0A8H5M0J9_9AGAR|nr:hypothetical protein D9757_008657 [Collybiopsis confluens]